MKSIRPAAKIVSAYCFSCSFFEDPQPVDDSPANTDKVRVRPNMKLRGILEKASSQDVVHRRLGSLEVLLRIHKTKTVVKIILLCLFHCAHIYTSGAKAMAGNTAGALA